MLIKKINKAKILMYQLKESLKRLIKITKSINKFITRKKD